MHSPCRITVQKSTSVFLIFYGPMNANNQFDVLDRSVYLFYDLRARKKGW